MEKIYIFGAGSTGRKILNKLKNDYIILGFLDNDESHKGMMVEEYEVLGGVEWISKQNNYDKIVIASLPGMDIITHELIEARVPIQKIDKDYVSVQVRARENFIRDYANTISCKNYNIAEGGVFQGEFAKILNEVFPKSKLYLFDTFSGFNEKDSKKEQENEFSVLGSQKHLDMTSVELVMSKMKYPKQVIIKKGYFPETTGNIMTDEKFAFVNLDFDLYNPTLAGLNFFYPRMFVGSVILIHDYFNPGFKGVKAAVDDFEKINGKLCYIPIGDNCSIAIIKKQ